MIFLGHLGITTAIIKQYEKLDEQDTSFHIDYRFVLIGAILPDIIDKTTEIFVNHRIQFSGRLYGHTLLFSLILMIIGMISNFKRINTFTIGLCSLIHIMIDGLWIMPKSFFFPMFGVNLLSHNDFVKVPYLTAFFNSSAYLITGELIGGFLLYVFFEKTFRNKTYLRSFLKHGIVK